MFSKFRKQKQTPVLLILPFHTPCAHHLPFPKFENMLSPLHCLSPIAPVATLLCREFKFTHFLNCLCALEFSASAQERKWVNLKSTQSSSRCLFHKAARNRLLIPTAFIACIDKVLPNKAILKNRHGRLWQVEVVKTVNRAYFQNGWANFVEDNSLELGEFLVFRYNGDYIFYVKLFGRSGCEKKDTMTSANIDKKISFINIKEEEEEEEGKHSEKQKEKVREEEDDGDNDDDDNIYKEEDFGDDDDDEEEDDNDDEEKDYDDGEEEDDDDDNGDNDEEEKDYDDEEEEEAKAYGSHRKKGGCKGQNEGSPTVKVENCNGINVGRYVQPKNAYFVTRLLSWKRGKVYVPTNVLKNFNIQLRQEMILRDQYGREWAGKVVVWKDGRSWIGGWNAFCKWNKVTIEDICICEFIGSRGYKRNLIQVHIVRAGQAP